MTARKSTPSFCSLRLRFTIALECSTLQLLISMIESFSLESSDSLRLVVSDCRPSPHDMYTCHTFLESFEPSQTKSPSSPQGKTPCRARWQASRTSPLINSTLLQIAPTLHSGCTFMRTTSTWRRQIPEVTTVPPIILRSMMGLRDISRISG